MLLFSLYKYHKTQNSELCAKRSPFPPGRVFCAAHPTFLRKKQKGEHPQADIPPQLTQNA
jgi:hypothetical protein